MDSPLSPPEPPQPHQPHRPHQLGNVLDIHSSKFSHWTSPIGDNDSYVTNTNNIATNYDNEPVMNIAYNSKNHATNEWISEVRVNFYYMNLIWCIRSTLNFTLKHDSSSRFILRQKKIGDQLFNRLISYRITDCSHQYCSQNRESFCMPITILDALSCNL